MKHKAILFISVPLIILLILGSCAGILTTDLYINETPNWKAQSFGQDLINLFLIAPSLIAATFFAYKNNTSAIKIHAGINLYLIYTFVLFCFDVHFNQLFFLYCCCLGLSFYSFVYFIYSNSRYYNENYLNKSRHRLIGFYLITVALVFYILWLAEIVPAIIFNSMPQSVIDVGLPTNGVHVLDLAIILPGIFITGILFLNRKQLGFTLGPVILTFFVLMNITIGVLAIVMKFKGIQSDLTLTVIMVILAVISLILLIGSLRNINYIKK